MMLYITDSIVIKYIHAAFIQKQTRFYSEIIFGGNDHSNRSDECRAPKSGESRHRKCPVGWSGYGEDVPSPVDKGSESVAMWAPQWGPGRSGELRPETHFDVFWRPPADDLFYLSSSNSFMSHNLSSENYLQSISFVSRVTWEWIWCLYSDKQCCCRPTWY